MLRSITPHTGSPCSQLASTPAAVGSPAMLRPPYPRAPPCASATRRVGTASIVKAVVVIPKSVDQALLGWVGVHQIELVAGAKDDRPVRHLPGAQLHNLRGRVGLCRAFDNVEALRVDEDPFIGVETSKLALVLRSSCKLGNSRNETERSRAHYQHRHFRG